MRFPLSWLKDYLATSLTPERLAESLTSLGLEVDALYPIEGKNDHLFEISLTPNLGHAMSLYGIARELAPLTEELLTFPPFAVHEEENVKISSLSVAVEAPDAAPRYACRLLLDVKVAPSPKWLQDRLEAAGLRPISNVVDVTNYVCLELGHPLHAFDLDKLQGGVAVRKATEGEKIVTLDGKERALATGTLVISDQTGPIAVAGVMGSAASEVSDSTRRVLLEAAVFDPVEIRKSAKQLGIQTESSKRFERGVDAGAVMTALNRAASLLQEIAGVKVASGAIDKGTMPLKARMLSCRLAQVHRVLGVKLALTEVTTLFERLQLFVKSTQDDTIVVEIPTYRNDLRREIDLIEEIARLYGYDNIFQSASLPEYRGSPHLSHPLYVFEKEVRQHLLEAGLQELLTCDLISPEEADLISPDCFPKRSLIRLLNPSSIEQSILRPSMLPNLLRVVKYNAAHEKHDVAGFEVGRVHFQADNQYHEPSVMAVILSGRSAPPGWDTPTRLFDFFDLKGVLENLFQSLLIKGIEWMPSHFEAFHPKRQARIMYGGHELGIIGEVHPQRTGKLDLKQPVIYAEINLSDLKPLVAREPKMQPLPQFPGATRDWTVTVPESYAIGQLQQLIDSARTPLVERVFVLGIYRGERVGPDLKNVTFRFIYRDREKTLSLADVDALHIEITGEVIRVLKSGS